MPAPGGLPLKIGGSGPAGRRSLVPLPIRKITDKVGFQGTGWLPVVEIAVGDGLA